MNDMDRIDKTEETKECKCNLHKDSCYDCWHFRYDKERDKLTCFAEQDEKDGTTARIEACPLGGDITNDCDGCAYSGDYHYDPETGDCVLRKD